MLRNDDSTECSKAQKRALEVEKSDGTMLPIAQTVATRATCPECSQIEVGRSRGGGFKVEDWHERT